LETDGIFHFGNIPSNETFLAARRRQWHHFKTRYYQLQFQGCLNNIQINSRSVRFDAHASDNIRTCYEHEESGVFFHGRKDVILGEITTPMTLFGMKSMRMINEHVAR
jgi:hypothetical protein